jgi:hypothetical protein
MKSSIPPAHKFTFFGQLEEVDRVGRALCRQMESGAFFKSLSKPLGSPPLWRGTKERRLLDTLALNLNRLTPPSPEFGITPPFAKILDEG